MQIFYTMFKSKDDSLDCRYQKAGFLLKLPFMGKGTGRWQKRWFVLKDGYLLYMSRGPIPNNKKNNFQKAWRQICIYSLPEQALKIFRKQRGRFCRGAKNEAWRTGLFW